MTEKNCFADKFFLSVNILDLKNQNQSISCYLTKALIIVILLYLETSNTTLILNYVKKCIQSIGKKLVHKLLFVHVEILKTLLYSNKDIVNYSPC